MLPESQKKSRTPENAVTVFIGMGSNLGDRAVMFRRAIHLMDQLPGTEVIELAPLYYTDPVAVGGGEFLNSVALLQTTLSPVELWRSLEEIESSLGRTAKWEKRQRTIDLDLLLYGAEVIDTPSLSIPHPRLAERAFVLRPLNDLAPEAVVPPEHITVARLWERLVDKAGLRPATDITIAKNYSANKIAEGHQ